MSDPGDDFKRHHPNAARLLERIIMWPYRRRLRRAERERLQTLESAIVTCRVQHAKFHEHGLADTAAVFNASLINDN